VLRTLIALSVLVLALSASTLSAGTTAPVTDRAWKAVLSDWLTHGTFAEPHSCAAAVVARTHAPPTYKEGSPLVDALDVYELSLCPSSGTPLVVRVGMSNTQVAEIGGVPVPSKSGPHCWLYRWADLGVDGARICFTIQGYVDFIQTGTSPGSTADA